MDGKVDDKETVVNKDLGIAVREVEPWIAEVKPLAEFDEEGRQYEYILLETDGVNNYIPEYDITKDNEGNYYAEVINRPGDGNRIMVRKNWNDNSDIAHRHAVTITAYAKETDEEINSVALGSVEDGGRNDVWYDWLGIGEYALMRCISLRQRLTGSKYLFKITFWIQNKRRTMIHRRA